jgi:hypothetical protein
VVGLSCMGSVFDHLLTIVVLHLLPYTKLWERDIIILIIVRKHSRFVPVFRENTTDVLPILSM